MKNCFMKFVVILYLSTIIGCTVKYSYHRSSDLTYPPKSEDCDFQVRSSHPGENYVEVGIVAVDLGPVTPPQGTSDPIVFKEKIKRFVCKAGGDVVVGEVNGYGQYIRGTVFRKKANLK